jgi:hypothetical protein
MTSDDEIPERFQRILERIGNSVSEIQQVNTKVVIQPDPLSIEIFLAIESGIHRPDQLQKFIGISRTILLRRLNTMESIGILVKQEYSIAPRRFEYVINDNEDGTAGQPAVVPV